MWLLDKLPTKIESKPDFFEDGHKRFVIMDGDVYLIDDDISEEQLLSIWRKSGFRKRAKVKHMCVKSGDKTYKVEVIDDFFLTCECNEYRIGKSCEHLNKIKKYFT